MTTTETSSPYVEPHVYVETVQPVRRGSALAAAVALYLGGYLVLFALSGQLVSALAGFGGGPEYLPLFGGQALFAVVAVIVGLLLAPAVASRKIIAILVVVVGVGATLGAEVARLTSNVGGVPLSMTLGNPYFMTVLVLGAAWLIVRYARLGWLALLLAFVLIPLPYLFSFAGISLAITQPVLLIITGIIGLAILAAGRGPR